jgi:ABC-2 type transport system permease protein
VNAFVDGFLAAFAAIFRDRAAVATMLAAVVIYSFYYPAAYTHQVATRLPTVVVDLDRSPMSRALLRKVQAVRAIDVIEPANTVEAASRRVADGTAEGVLLIDANFQRDILRGGQGHLTLLGEGAFLGRASTVLAGLADAIGGFSRDAVVERARFQGAPSSAPFALVQRPLFNTREGYASAVVTGVSVLIVQQTLLLGIVLLAGTRRELRGRLRFPATKLLGAMAAFWVLGMLNLLYYAGFVYWFHDFPRGGNLPGLLVCGTVYIAAVVAAAAFVGSYFRVREQAIQAILLTAMPLYFLSGLSWPETSMPVWLAWLGKLVPSTAGINAMVKLNEMGAHIAETANEMTNLVALVALYGLLAMWRYRERR